MSLRFEPLSLETLHDVVCCPEGLEVSGKLFLGDLSETIAWRRRMIDLGMSGVIAYDESGARGFAEYMPAETAPMAIDAPGAAILMCYHWAGTDPEDPEHLSRERLLIERVLDETKGRFVGLATHGWDAPTHFPIPFLEGLGFRGVARSSFIALMWHPFSEEAAVPRFSDPTYVPRNLASEGLLAIDAAFSARCPYGISSEARLSEAIASHPMRNRIRPSIRRIDTREDALALAVPPFDWSWVYLNGEEVSLFELPGEELATEIGRRIEEMP